MKDIVIDTISSFQNEYSPKWKHCFELLGYDFLIDQDYWVWLLEVNTNPYLGMVNEYITGLLPKMIDEALALTLDKWYEPLNKTENTNLFTLLDKSQRWNFDVGIYPIQRAQTQYDAKSVNHTSFHTP